MPANSMEKAWSRWKSTKLIGEAVLGKGEPNMALTIGLENTPVP